jgi:hypothetical protein
MGLNPLKQKTRQLLAEARERSYQDLAHYREKRQKFIAQFAGHHYSGERRGEEDTLVPSMYQLVETYVQTLVANNPRYLAETEFTTLKSFARRFALNLNSRVAKINLKTTLQKIVLDACFMMGIGMVHNSESTPLDFGEYGVVDPGAPGVSHIPFDDFFYDTTAKSLEECAFIGHYYTISWDTIDADPNISRKVKDRVQKVFENEPTRDGQSLTRTMSQGTGSTAELLVPKVEVANHYLPRERVVVTLFKNGDDMPPLRIHEWGGESCPYRLLTLADVPDNIMGLPPSMIIEPLHTLLNNIWGKLKNQANRQKTTVGYIGGAEQDAMRQKDAVDGEYIKMVNPNGVKVFEHSGPNQNLAAFGISVQQQTSRAGGNLDVMAGLAQQADTATQEGYLYGAVSKKESKMIERVLDFTSNIGRDLGFLMWNNQFLEQDAFHTAPNGTLKVAYPWRPWHREGNYDQYVLRVIPHSMRSIAPDQRYQRIMNHLAQLAPYVPLMQQQGQTINLGELNEMASEYLDEPWLRNIIQAAQPSPSDPNNFAGEVLKGGAPKAGKPNGQYTRINKRAPGSDEYADKMVQAAMLGQKPGGQQQAGIYES